jgi:hypothetical protein
MARLECRQAAPIAYVAIMMLARLAALPIKHPSAALLFVQVLSILLYPLLQDTAMQRGGSASSACWCSVRRCMS